LTIRAKRGAKLPIVLTVKGVEQVFSFGDYPESHFDALKLFKFTSSLSNRRHSLPFSLYRRCKGDGNPKRQNGANS
jgi:hypothetical protein